MLFSGFVCFDTKPLNPGLRVPRAWGLPGLGHVISGLYPKALRTHILRLLGPKTILYKAFGPF